MKRIRLCQVCVEPLSERCPPLEIVLVDKDLDHALAGCLTKRGITTFDVSH